MNYLIKLLIFLILNSTAIIYAQSKMLGHQTFTLGQKFDEIKYRETIQWSDTTDVEKKNGWGMIWEDKINVGYVGYSNGKIYNIRKSWEMRVNPNEAISLFNVIFNVCEIVFGERTDDLTINISELKQPNISSKTIEILKFSDIDDNQYLTEAVTLRSYDNGSYNIVESVSLRSNE